MPGTGSDYCQRAGGWTPDNPGIRVRQSAWDGVVNLIGSGAPGSCKAFDASMREEPFAVDLTAEDRPASCTVLETDAAWVQAIAIPAAAAIAASTGYREMRTTMCTAVANYKFYCVRVHQLRFYRCRCRNRNGCLLRRHLGTRHLRRDGCCGVR